MAMALSARLILNRHLANMQEKGSLPLFGDNRQFSTAVTDRFHLLHRMKIDAEIVHSACELLAQKGVLVLISDAEKLLARIKDHSVPLYRIDIDAIGRLSRGFCRLANAPCNGARYLPV